MLLLIIWGSRGVVKTAGQGHFHCPRCQQTTPYQHKKVQRYFTLYFIPLFPIATSAEYVECAHCIGRFQLSVLQLPAGPPQGAWPQPPQQGGWQQPPAQGGWQGQAPQGQPQQGWGPPQQGAPQGGPPQGYGGPQGGQGWGGPQGGGQGGWGGPQGR